MTEQDLKKSHVSKCLSQAFVEINAGNFDEATDKFKEALIVLHHADIEPHSDEEVKLLKVKARAQGSLAMAMNAIIFGDKEKASTYIDEAIYSLDQA
ncbi:MAG: hypothetical protein LC687_01090 [Actinobacteria bacterium]|nr:hypothetical protein [Actinomycetota bacterium]